MSRVFDTLVEELRGFVHGETERTGQRLRRFRVMVSDPLLLEALDGDLVIEEGDPDVEIDRDVLAARPAPGDIVLVDETPDDYAVRGVVTHG